MIQTGSEGLTSYPGLPRPLAAVEKNRGVTSSTPRFYLAAVEKNRGVSFSPRLRDKIWAWKAWVRGYRRVATRTVDCRLPSTPENCCPRQKTVALLPTTLPPYTSASFPGSPHTALPATKAGVRSWERGYTYTSHTRENIQCLQVAKRKHVFRPGNRATILGYYM